MVTDTYNKKLKQTRSTKFRPILVIGATIYKL